MGPHGHEVTHQAASGEVMPNRMSDERLAVVFKYIEQGIPSVDGWAIGLNKLERELANALVAEREHTKQLESQIAG